MRGRTITTLLVSVATLVTKSSAQQASSQPLTLVISADLGTVTINRHIYGQFAEHLGRGIYDGVWTRSESEAWHLREDVIAALRVIQVPNIRWPGGCFADYYHWKDGIGPRGQRPTIVNTIWGGVTEDNSFGTHEFLELAARIGAEPFIVGNVGSGTVEEMADWWEYVNFPGTSPMADQRRANGREEPWGVRMWGVGNESWGCGGSMSAEHYADVYKRFQTFLHRYGDLRPFRVATGPGSADYEWTEVVMREAGRYIDGLDLHHYALVGSWSESKGSATDFGEEEWFATMRSTVRMRELIERTETIMDRYDPRKRVALIVGEWGTWYEVEPGTNPGFLYQQNSLRDAVAAAYNLNLFNNHAERVRGANIAQMVNVLQAMLLTRGNAMILTPTYHVFEMFTPHHDATLLPITLDEGTYAFGDESVPAVSVSASRGENGHIHITLANLDPHEARAIAAEVRGAQVSSVTGRILTAAAMTAHNTFDDPDAVRPATFGGARLDGNRLDITLPGKSVVVLEVQ
jgi:alpha-N-arabinofuranosidase